MAFMLLEFHLAALAVAVLVRLAATLAQTLTVTVGLGLLHLFLAPLFFMVVAGVVLGTKVHQLPVALVVVEVALAMARALPELLVQVAVVVLEITHQAEMVVLE
jgi:hypothetical protein